MYFCTAAPTVWLPEVRVTVMISLRCTQWCNIISSFITSQVTHPPEHLFEKVNNSIQPEIKLFPAHLRFDNELLLMDLSPKFSREDLIFTFSVAVCFFLFPIHSHTYTSSLSVRRCQCAVAVYSWSAVSSAGLFQPNPDLIVSLTSFLNLTLTLPLVLCPQDPHHQLPSQDHFLTIGSSMPSATTTSV